MVDDDQGPPRLQQHPRTGVRMEPQRVLLQGELAATPREVDGRERLFASWDWNLEEETGLPAARHPHGLAYELEDNSTLPAPARS